MLVGLSGNKKARAALQYVLSYSKVKIFGKKESQMLLNRIRETKESF